MFNKKVCEQCYDEVIWYEEELPRNKKPVVQLFNIIHQGRLIHEDDWEDNVYDKFIGLSPPYTVVDKDECELCEKDLTKEFLSDLSKSFVEETVKDGYLGEILDNHFHKGRAHWFLHDYLNKPCYDDDCECHGYEEFEYVEKRPRNPKKTDLPTKTKMIVGGVVGGFLVSGLIGTYYGFHIGLNLFQTGLTALDNNVLGGKIESACQAYTQAD